MAMNPSGIRRNLKNIVHNYSDAQVKVREATSNDPWGPSSTLMSEIADLTYNVVAFSEIMQMIWKRLNDHGKNWRHVYKALVLLEYLIKTGTEKVAQQCKENIFAIQTLKDFQYIEDNKDQGMNVREKAKQLVSLLRDDDRLKNERARALKAKERFAQASSGIGSEVGIPQSGFRSDSFTSNSHEAGSPQAESNVSGDLESARPQTVGEEELQLQLALAMSKEEADQEEQKRKSDDVRLQMAITQSQEDFRGVQSPGHSAPTLGMDDQHRSNRDDGTSSALLDLLNTAPSSNILAYPSVATDPWGMPFKSQTKVADPWLASLNNRAASTPPIASDPWAPKGSSRSGTPLPGIGCGDAGKTEIEGANNIGGKMWNNAPQPSSTMDPWGVPLPAGANGTQASSAFGSTPSLATNGDLDGFDVLSSRSVPSKSTNNLDCLEELTPNPFEANGLQQNTPRPFQPSVKRTPESFLGENSGLVNLDALVSSKPPEQSPATTNPFSSSTPNPFQLQQQQQQQQRPSINQLRSQQQFGPQMMNLSYSANFATQSGFSAGPPPPMTSNPFL